jgi:hypothetical protein
MAQSAAEFTAPTMRQSRALKKPKAGGPAPLVASVVVAAATGSRKAAAQESFFGLRWQSAAATPLLPEVTGPQSGVALSLPAAVQKRTAALRFKMNG